MNHTQKEAHEDFDKLKPVLEKLEKDTLRDTGLKNRNGAFASAEMFDYDDECFDVELTWGIQCGSDDDVTHTEQYKVNRETWEVED